MSEIVSDKSFSSENPIIQKCFDILEKENVQIVPFSERLLFVKIGAETQYRVSDTGLRVGTNRFYADKIYDGMNFEDIEKLYNRCYELYRRGDHERVQAALEQLSDKPDDKQQQQSFKLFNYIRNSWFRGIFAPCKKK